MNHKIRCYDTFGLRETWLCEFFDKGLQFLTSHLGPVQVKSVRKWYIDVGLIDSTLIATEFTNYLCDEYSSIQDRFMFIIARSYYSCGLLNFLINNCYLNSNVTTYEMKSLLHDKTSYSERTISNLMASLLNTFYSIRTLASLNIFELNWSANRIISFTRNPITGVRFDHILYLLYEIQCQEQRSEFVLDEYPRGYNRCSIGKLYGLKSHQIYDLLFSSERWHSGIIKSYDTNSVEIHPGLSSIEALCILKRNREGT